ncbi:nipped-B-like protein A isoform X2 [Clavelina lepadiformis]|uniref:nipped-B-like protein A isoform X2 n=1 Tax=Clavelina lepadiformis TaxID=159417 RepID=UPI0040434A36
MNFNSDVSKIPSGIPPYPIPGITDLIEELPHTTQTPHHLDAASRILNTPDAALVSHIVDAFASNPSDLIQHDSSNRERVGASPLLPGVFPRTSDVYTNKNMQPNLNPNLPHVALFNPMTQNPSTSVSISAYPPVAEPVAGTRMQSLYQGNSSRPPVSKPVQAVAPQPRHPPQVEKTVHAENTTMVYDQKANLLVNSSCNTPVQQEENPKICLKIRRTKKGHKHKEKHSSKHSMEYGIVSSDNKPEGAGPIKLKLSRVKQAPMTDGNKVSTEQSFKVSSLTMPETKSDASAGMDQKQAEDAATAMVKALFKENHPSSQLNTPDVSTTKSRNSKNEKRHKHKHKINLSQQHPNSEFVNSNESRDVLQQRLNSSMFLPSQPQHSTQIHTASAANKSNPMYPQTNPPHLQQQGSHSNPAYNATPYMPHNPNFHSTPMQGQQSQMQSQFISSTVNTHLNQTGTIQGHFRSPSVMPQYNSNAQQEGTAFSPNISSHPTQKQQMFSSSDMWNVSKSSHHSYFGHANQRSQMEFASKPPPYTEAVLTQQQSHNQFYQPVNHSSRAIESHSAIYSQNHQQSVHPPQQNVVRQPGHQHPGHIKRESSYQENVVQQTAFQSDHDLTRVSQNISEVAQQTPFQMKVSEQVKSQFPLQESAHITLPSQILYEQTRLQSASTESLQIQQPHVSLERESLTYNTFPPQQATDQQMISAKPIKNVNYMNTPSSNEYCASQSNAKAKKKGHKQTGGFEHVRVKFIADAEEADIYKLKDIMYPDDTEVSSFSELQPGMQVVAKWPMNGKLYAAVVIDPLDNTGRRFRERKPPPKPFQVQQTSSRKDKKSFHEPSVVLNKLDPSALPSNIMLAKALPEPTGDEFGAYISMADRIKLKRRERMQKDWKPKDGKKRKRTASTSSERNLISLDVSDEEFTSPARKRSHQEEVRKKERRRTAESRIMHGDVAGSFQRLTSMIATIFDEMDALDPRLLNEAQSGQKEGKIPQCLLLSRAQLQYLSGETAKIKAMGIMHQMPKQDLVRLLTLLEPNMRDGVNLKPLKPKGNSPEEQKWNRECRLDRVNSATEAALTAMNIMTAKYMPKAVYLDDVMDRAAQLLRQQLNNTIYPEYDLVYKGTSSQKKKGQKELTSTASTKMKRAHYKGTKNRAILQLYNKLNILLSLWEELVMVQPLTDTTILQISSVGISPFFVENVRELQLSAIRLTTGVFSRYDKHRSLLLEDIFQSLARLPTSKRNLRNYRLTFADEVLDSSDEEDHTSGRKGSAGVSGGELQHIQMVSALILQMIHAIVHIPLPEPEKTDIAFKDAKIQHEVDELKVVTSYEMAVKTAQTFLSVFLKKCASKNEDIDYRPLFENLVHDLLATVNKPEWPASEMLLSLLGRLLVHTFSTKSTEMSLRVASLDYLGVVAAKLRRDAITSRTDVSTVQGLLRRLEEAGNEQDNEHIEQVDKQEKEPQVNIENVDYVVSKPARKRTKALAKKKKSNKQKKQKQLPESEEEILTLRLQYLLLGYLRRNADADQSLLFAYNFYIGQWLRDVALEFQQFQQLQDQGKVDDSIEAQSSRLQACQRKKDALMELTSSASVAASVVSGQTSDQGGVKKPVNLSELQKNADKLAAGLTVEDAALVSRHLASTRPFSKAFDSYLSYILRVREESAVALRTRAIKCLAEVVAVDPSIMERDDIAQSVQSSLVDGSTSVREAAIDLIGRFVILKPDLVKHYYVMLTARILDTGVSVRKRVIRILRDLCHEYPDLPQLTDACVKMIRRVNDEDGIKKLVHDVFMKMWFTPVDPQDAASLKKKALLITDIVAANKERGYEWIEQLFKNLIDTPIPNPHVELSCQQIVDCLVQHVIIFENPNSKQGEYNQHTISQDSSVSANTSSQSKDRSVRLVATIQTMVQLARIRPRLLVTHVMTLQPYLATKCEMPDDVLTVHGVCRILELAIPLMEHPPEAFLASIEEDMMRMILTHRFHVVSAAVACLSAITCQVTFNYKLIWDCFQRMCSGLSNARALHLKTPEAIFHPKHLKQLLRTLFIIGHFCKNFDFDNEHIKGKTQICVKDKVYDCLLYFVNLETTSKTEELRGYSIAALGLLMVQDPNMMFRNSTKDLYRTLLDPRQPSDRLKKQVLQNLQNYLQTEDVKMQQAAEASVKKHKQEMDGIPINDPVKFSIDDPATDEDIKEICDVSSGMASSVMQLFLKQVLESFFHRHVMVRHAALHTVYLTLQQGLVHPVQCVPYLIAAASDFEAIVYKEADQQLVELNKRYHGFVHTKALQGMRLAYQLQSYTQQPNKIVRGFLESATAGDEPCGVNKASCSQLYYLVRSDRKHRRTLLLSLLKLFDDTVKTDLGMLVFVADNLAHFPYHTLDEPLFLMSQIEVYVSVSGSNVLQSFKEQLQKKTERRERRAANLEEKEKRQKERGSDEEDSSSSSSLLSEDDSDDEGSIESRLPLHDDGITEFAHLSLACLLLLWLKQHLKTLFGFTDKKIHRYSPSEVNRANDKQCHRKKPDLKFEPTQALQHIQRLRTHMSCRHPEYIAAVVRQFKEFNELMNKLDPNEEDSDSEKEKKTPSKLSSTASIPPDPSKEDEEESDRDTDGEMPKPAAPLDVIRQSTALKSKKHSRQRSGEMRKRAEVRYLDSSSDSEEEFRGF